MTTGTIVAFVAALGIGAVLALLIRIRARTVIGRLDRNLRRTIAKQQETIARQRQELAKQRRELAKQHKKIVRQNKSLAVTTDQVARLEGRTALRDARKPLPPRPTNAKRSVLFLHNGSYHFPCLAAALRRRGWDAVVVSNFPTTYDSDRPLHGEDANLFSHDPYEFRARLRGLFDLVPDRFHMVHFGGPRGNNTGFFRDSVDRSSSSRNEAQWDFQALKEKGVKVGYTISGCRDGIRQTVYKNHKNVCKKCAWELRPDVCSDERNAAWGEMLTSMCDLVAVEDEYGHEWRTQPFVYREPLTTALDSDYWKPSLKIPESWRMRRTHGELIAFHCFADAATHRFAGRDIKGTRAVFAAIERLRSEGLKIRLVHPSAIPSRDPRFILAQADIIVDQLVLGRYGAQACEGMMLGKPVVCHIDRREPAGVSELSCWNECPLVDATEETIYPVLKQLLMSPEERERIGRASRVYAIKWHDSDSAAARYERIYDRIMAGLPLNVPESEIRGSQ